ncbi:glycosyltransferase family 4 protein [Salegentibacter mishustinae]|uniref:glycosyltransferase family 4 protein n=1 Tax=Salegentibacter mishustinae TaxID=270918 RepID=UPI002490DA1B|nr:glycosyltransferase family 4 protein [Salegentibacter mishustinae]
MKIINLIQKPQLRGAEIFACQLSEHFLMQGYEVIVVAIYGGDAKLPFSGEIIKLNRTHRNRFWDFQGWKQFSEIVKRYKPDIIQANASDTLKFSVSSKLIYKWNSKIVFRNANKMGDFIDSSWKLKLNSFYLSQINYVVSVSKECEIDFKKTFNFPSEKIETVEIGVEEKNIGSSPLDLKEVFDNHKVVTHIGGFVPEKNHHGLINIVGEVVKDFPELKLLLLGDGRLRPEIVSTCKEKGLENNILFLGYRNDVLEILSSSDVFVLPSFIEGLPGVILEAMYCETPVIANDVGGIKEIVIDNKTGFLIDKNEPEVFKDRLLSVLINPELTKQTVINAKKMVNDKFTNNIISDRFINVYRSLL